MYTKHVLLLLAVLNESLSDDAGRMKDLPWEAVNMDDEESIEDDVSNTSSRQTTRSFSDHFSSKAVLTLATMSRRYSFRAGIRERVDGVPLFQLTFFLSILIE